jgi:hypothetical protein
MLPSANVFAIIIPGNSNLPLVRQSIVRMHEPSYDFAKVPDWDGNGAVALTDDVIHLADNLAVRFGSSHHLVEVSPGRDGSLSLVWDDNLGNYIYLDVGPNKTVHLFYDVVGFPKWEGVSVASDLSILQHLARAFAFLSTPSERFISIPTNSNSAPAPVFSYA